MAYPVPPDSPRTVRPDPAQMWAGGAATAVVAALLALVGILVCRWALNIAILAPQGDGAWGDAHTGEYVLVAALIALVATGVLHLLMLGAPRPTLFFGWIAALLTAVAAVYPFSTSAPLSQKAATAAVDLIIGVAIISLLIAVAGRAVRRNVSYRPPTVDQQPHDQRQPYDQSQPYGQAQRPPYDQRQPYDPEAPTRPVNPRAPGQWS
jgi:hypothetical protein